MVAKRVPAGRDQLASVIRAALGCTWRTAVACTTRATSPWSRTCPAGPVRLLDDDYPDREPMLSIAEYKHPARASPAAAPLARAARYAKVKFDDPFASFCPLVVVTVSVTV